MGQRCERCGTPYNGWSCPACSQREKDEARERQHREAMQRHEENLAESRRAMQEEHQHYVEEQEEAHYRHLEAIEESRERELQRQQYLYENRGLIEASGEAKRAADLLDAGLHAQALKHARNALEKDGGNLDAYIIAALACNVLRRDSNDYLRAAAKVWKSFHGSPELLIPILRAVPEASPVSATLADLAVEAVPKWASHSEASLGVARWLKRLGWDQHCERVLRSLVSRGATPKHHAAYLAVTASMGHPDLSFLQLVSKSEFQDNELRCVLDEVGVWERELTVDFADLKSQLTTRIEEHASKRREAFLAGLPDDFLHKVRNAYDSEMRSALRKLEGKFHLLWGLSGFFVCLYLTKLVLEFVASHTTDQQIVRDLYDILTTLDACTLIAWMMAMGCFGHLLSSIRPILSARASYRRRLHAEIKAYREHLQRLPHGYPRFLGPREFLRALRTRLIATSIVAAISVAGALVVIAHSATYKDLRTRWTGFSTAPVVQPAPTPKPKRVRR